MFDSGSDSEVSNSTTLNQTETSDGQILAEVRQDQLQEDNATLVKEINVLRAQFEQAVAMSKKSGELIKEMDSLKQQLFAAVSQKEDMQRRLEISIKAKEEAVKQLEDEHAKNSAQREADVKAMHKELIKTKKAFQQKMDVLYSQNQKLQAEKDADDIAQKTLVGKIDKLVINASHYLNRDISSFDELCSLMESPNILEMQQNIQSKKPQQPVPQPPQVKKINDPFFNISQQDHEYYQQQIKEANKKAKKAKAELKAAISKINELNSTIVKKDVQTEQLKFQHKNELESMNDKINAIREENDQKEIENKKKTQQLLEKINSLKEELQNKEKTINQMQPMHYIQQQQNQNQQLQQQQNPQINAFAAPYNDQIQIPNLINDKSKEDKRTNEQLSLKIRELQSQLNSANKAKEEIKKQLQQTEKKVNEMLISRSTEANELKALKTVHKETLNEVETLRQALHARSESTVSKKEIDAKRREQQRQKAQMQQLQNTNEELKKHAYDVQLENEKCNQTIREQNQEIENLQNMNQDLQNSISLLKGEITDLKQREQDVIPMTEEDFFPRSMWTSTADFDSNLMQAISKVSNNEALRAPSKLQHIYKAIQKYYTKQIDSIKRIADEANSDAQKMLSYMSDFIVSLSIAMNDKAESFDNFMQDSDIPAALVSRVSYFRNQLVEVNRSKDNMQQIIDSIANAFGIHHGPDFYQQIVNLRDHFEQSNVQNEKRKQKTKKLKEQFNELQSKYDCDMSALQAENQRLLLSLNTTKENLTNTTESNRKMKAELAETKRVNKELQEKYDDLKQSTSEEINELRQERDAKMVNMKDRYEKTIATISQELVRCKTVSDEAESQFAKYKKELAAKDATIQEKDNEIEQTKKQSEQDIKKMAENCDAEKQQIVDQYEKAVQELTEQCQKHRQDTVKLSGKLAQLEKRYKEAKSYVLQLRTDCAKLEKQNQLKCEELERAEKITQSTVKSSVVAAESQFNSRLAEQKTKFEAEKRRLISFAADEFRQYFNANDSIDERTYHSIIIKVKDELSRLQRIDGNIRRIIGASGRQTTDDAVAQLLMGCN